MRCGSFSPRRGRSARSRVAVGTEGKGRTFACAHLPARIGKPPHRRRSNRRSQLTPPSQEIAPKETALSLNYADAMQMAKTIASSNLCPASLRGKPADVFVVLARGQEMGLSPMLALQNLYVVNGKIGISADLMRARCLEQPDGVAFDVAEADAKHAVVRVMKPQWSQPVDVRFDVTEAQTAGLIKPESNWSKWPQDMNVARATSRAARRYFPGVLAVVYTKEELEDLPVEQPERPAIAMPRAIEVEPPAQTEPTDAEMEADDHEVEQEQAEENFMVFYLSIPREAWAEVRRLWHNGGTISEAQRRRLFAIAATNGWTGDQVNAALEAGLGGDSTTLPWGKPYEKVVGIFSEFQPRTEQLCRFRPEMTRQDRLQRPIARR